MNKSDYIALLPLLITGYVGALLMVLVAFIRAHTVAFAVTLISFIAALVTVVVALPYAPRAITPLIEIDAFSLYFSGLILAGAILITLMSYDYLRAHSRTPSAFYVLLMFAVVGFLSMAQSAHFVAFFLGLEVASIALYGLIGYISRFNLSLEAAIKYLVLAASSSAFLLFGIALVYAEFGSMDFRILGPLMTLEGVSLTTFFGLGLIIVGFGFKLAVVPFHMWSPDVYQGAPSPVTALIATGSKGAVFALLLRFVMVSEITTDRTTYLTLAVLAVLTMLAGNLLALLQTNIKRLLAYSSIAQIGYLIIPLIAGGVLASSSIAFYLASYFATTIAAFAVISALSRTRELGDTEDLEDYRGLGLRHPVLAAILAISMLSLTGIPLTSGFIAKFYIFSAAVQAGLWWLLIVGVIASGISAFYYLRVLSTLYTRPKTLPEPLTNPGPSTIITLAVSTAVMLFFGIYPTPLIRLAESAMRGLGF